MKFVCIAYLLFLCIKIIQSRSSSVGWFVFAICTVSNDFYLGPLHAHFLFAFALIAKYIYLRYSNKGKLNKLPFNKVALIWVIGIIIVTIFDYENSIGSKMMTIIRESVNSILILTASIGILRIQGCRTFERFMASSLIIIFIFGLLQLLFGIDISHELSINYFPSDASEYSSMSDFNDAFEHEQLYSGRTRINSLVGFAFDFGYFSAALGLFSLYAYLNNKKKRYYLIISLVCGIGGTLMSGSRATILAVFGGYVMMYILYSKMKLQNLLLPGIIGIVILYFLSDLSIVQGTLDAFSDNSGSQYTGSSKDMRLDQLAASFYWFSQSPIVGNGYRFIQNASGFNDMSARVLGIESLIFDLLISTGIIGFIYWGAFLTQLFKKLTKNIKYLQYKLALSLTISFLIYSLVTGVQGSMFVTFPILAYCFMLPINSNAKVKLAEENTEVKENA